MMKRKFGKFALMLLTLGALALPFHAQQKSDLEEVASFEDKTDSLKFDFEMSDVAKLARLEVKVRMKSGRAEWKLRDPNGDVRLTGQGTRGNIKGETSDLKAIEGIWTLDLRLTAATGDCKVNWTVR